jgi:hypothetical protein
MKFKSFRKKNPKHDHKYDAKELKNIIKFLSIIDLLDVPQRHNFRFNIHQRFSLCKMEGLETS